MGYLSFTKASEFLASQLAAGNNVRKAGIIVRASLGAVVDVTQQLDDLFQGAWDKFDAAMERKLADLTDANQRAAVMFQYAGSLRLPVEEQLRLLAAGGKDSPSVSTAAAQQRGVAAEVQQYLVRECYAHKQAMLALTRNAHADLVALERLSLHPDGEVRLMVAANLGPRMRVTECETSDNDLKQAIYNNLLNLYESDFAPYLVPVCRDEQQLEQMYSRTAKTPSLLRHFVDNPFTSERVLLDVSTSMPIRMVPGGSAVASDAKQHLAKRLTAESDAIPQPY